ncbi:hypothetical protein DPMN_134309 [Dreissena polymorpha]|uniref:Uncharacterized protein n=1 Tax=Dreissena polymorpha TaxID=45954 RepID=A0A9D4JDQ2_DREPO|nr:hypothetical protein DPMN_134309 [Dreissena polymorpha]
MREWKWVEYEGMWMEYVVKHESKVCGYIMRVGMWVGYEGRVCGLSNDATAKRIEARTLGKRANLAYDTIYIDRTPDRRSTAVGQY